MNERKLNLDFAGSISELESMMNKVSFKWIIYQFLFRGKGLEFDGYRSYSPNDDASMIDWMATSRGGEILVKKYIEERDLKIMFLIDVGDGMVFGSAEKLKCECAAEVVAALSHLIVLSGDQVGFSLLNSKEEIILPLGGMRRFNFLAHELSSPENYGGRSKKLDNVLEFFVDYLDKSINAVFIISDFLNLGNNFSKNFQIFSQKFETIPIMVRDNLDETLPVLDSEFTLEDPSSGEQIVVNSVVAKREYEKKAFYDKKLLFGMFNDAGVEPLEIKTHESFIGKLVEFLNERAKKKRVVIPRS
jgi:hypothetical protein